MSASRWKTTRKKLTEKNCKMREKESFAVHRKRAVMNSLIKAIEKVFFSLFDCNVFIDNI
jgi:hypothetical protein